jgi:hypothetical protein
MDDVNSSLDELLYLTQSISMRQSRNPFNKFGLKIFSQSDEDGLTLEIIRRLSRINKISSNQFLEIGSGRGDQNNSLILLSLGWTGAWIDLPETDFIIELPDQLKLNNFKVDIESLQDYMLSENLVNTPLGLLSIDVDGNDYHILDCILKKGIRPSIIIVEYNGQLPPPISFVQKYDATHIWNGSNNYGSSLESLVRMLDLFGFKLVCCNYFTGANAFFVDSLSLDWSDIFSEVPINLEDIYIPTNFRIPRPNYFNFDKNLLRNIIEFRSNSST